ncbi:outer membrane autotransporter protein [Paraburkholderia sp. HC6.4b]|uniref:autotransporter outer membrane beta-barrel domain-containing protein n=1 Tax=Paraburkholderia sp. HC6.4b TaxID=2723095 RepID=UPI00161C3BBC|nr:autotransporter outer membrane beta-barrel domain-containing protein [Paraburkholderia sp. HC6.4b]MBB5409703.1 outer membrane autotransporter protein [Paraburkholderia sp. HC6.4b]MBB5451678.1 outer membrane autotransporter protein [Paraburkholderia sp. Kb1A]
MAARTIHRASLSTLAGGARGRLTIPLTTRHQQLNSFCILHAIWLMGLAPVPALAQQTVTERPNLSGSETIDTPANNVLFVGTDNTSTSFSGTINNAGVASDPTSQQGQFVKTGGGTLTIDGARIRGGSAFVIGGGLAATSSDAAIDYLSLGLGNAPTLPGSTSSGMLNVSGGTLTFNSALQVGDFGGTGTVTQTAGNVVFGMPGTPVSLNIGNQGGTGTYNLAGGTVTFGNSTTDFMTLGRNTQGNPSSGTLNLSGGTFDVADGTLFIGSNVTSTGSQGTGTINQTGGTLAIGSASRLFLAAAGNGTYNLSGGTLQIGGSSLFGDFNNLGGTYAFNLGGGTIQVVGSALSAGVNATLVGGTTSTIDTNGMGATWSGVLSGSGALAKAGNGVLTLTNANTYTGMTTISAGTLALTGSGSINLTSGMLNNGTFDISGVTSTPIPGVATGVVPLPNLSGSGTVIDGTNILVVGTDNTSTSFSGTIINAGTASDALHGIFVKTGAGTFTINGARIQGGSAFVVGGGLAVSSGSAAIDYLSLGLGNSLATQVPGSTSSGTLNVSGGTLTFNSALQVGDFGGTGTVTQTAGNVVFGMPGTPVSLNIGNQGGTGIYNLAGGTVAFGNSTTDFMTLGRNTQGNPSSGTLNLSGGTFNVANGTLFIGSNVVSSGSQGTGTINQTGGTLAIGSASRLFLAAAGNGTYNLSGGTLQIGGSSLFGDFNNLGGTYAFNLGGGTIQVVGSALSAGVNATLVGGTTSTIDTNGMGATWSGVLSGSGALAKAGNGVLTLSGQNTFTGPTNVRNGVLNLTGSLQSPVNVEANGTLGGTGTDLNTVTNAGTVEPGFGLAAGQFGAMTVKNFVGAGGTLALRTFLGLDGSPSDRLIINGGSADPTAVRITNAGGSGGLTTGNGILVVETTNGGTTASDAFALVGEARGGAEDYRLFRGGVNSSNPEDWFLRSSFVVPPPPEGGEEEPGTGPGTEPPPDPLPPGVYPIIGPELATYGVVQPVARQMGVEMLGTLHERIGDTLTTESGGAGGSGWASSAWGRVFGGQIDNRYEAYADPRVSGGVGGVQTGLDVWRGSVWPGHRDAAGVYFAYGYGSADVDGLVTNAAATGYTLEHTGSMHLNAYTGGGYWTHYGPSGWYVDAVVQGTHYDGSATTQFANLPVRGTGFATSLEGGYPIPLPLGPGFELEPQAQIIWQHVSFSDANDGLGDVSLGSTSGASGRLGVRGKWTIEGSQGAVWQPYVRANLWRDFNAQATTTFANDRVPLNVQATRLELAGGVTARLKERLNLYGQFGYQFAVSGDSNVRRSGVAGDLGVRYQW